MVISINNGKNTQPKYASLLASSASSRFLDIDNVKYPKLAINTEIYNHISHISFFLTNAQYPAASKSAISVQIPYTIEISNVVFICYSVLLIQPFLR